MAPAPGLGTATLAAPSGFGGTFLGFCLSGWQGTISLTWQASSQAGLYGGPLVTTYLLQGSNYARASAFSTTLQGTGGGAPPNGFTDTVTCPALAGKGFRAKNETATFSLQAATGAGFGFRSDVVSTTVTYTDFAL
jgi:hypothetical protein